MFPAMARGCWTGVDGVSGVTGVRPPRISSKPFLSAVSSMLGKADLKNDTWNRQDYFKIPSNYILYFNSINSNFTEQKIYMNTIKC